MRKILCALLLLSIPAIALARGGGSVGGFSSGGVRSYSTPAPSFRSYSAPATPRINTTPKVSAVQPSYASGAYNSYRYNYFPNWLLMYWMIASNNNQSWNKNDTFDTHDHFPYVLVVNKTAKDYLLVRYIGQDNKTEKVSSQEASGLTWLKSEINY